MAPAQPLWDIDSKERAKVLIVDDEPMNIRLLQMIFSDTYDLYMATSGEQAIHLTRVIQPDLILLDVVMPGIDGYQTCKILKEDPMSEPIPVIFVTGQNNEEEEVRGLQAGAVDFIHKPVNATIVKARVHTHIALKRQNDILRSFAWIDGLTGVANRRRFDDALSSAWQNSLRHTTPLSLIMIDVDHFKLFNDFYGHQEGDACLLAVAQTAKDSVHRPHDLVARYGGEEFVCLLPDTDANGCRNVTLRIMEKVADLHIPHERSTAGSHVTISAGLATLVATASLTGADLIRQADERLYRAKQAGRNRMEQDVSPTV